MKRFPPPRARGEPRNDNVAEASPVPPRPPGQRVLAFPVGLYLAKRADPRPHGSARTRLEGCTIATREQDFIALTPAANSLRIAIWKLQSREVYANGHSSGAHKNLRLAGLRLFIER